ncbi:hypothetical protein BGZ80_003521 [Entomortierella chlamydospora]|uniref:F-box domain protein n=1 Tax=Entomortierella chlamydospora TaxID=101097 RepID=A0A9P6MN39_9FUNG|nr:hypothetical protein BGZ79_000621 [Entomortierella chlamydospora]KAG0008378.1 hypothetical protein BGZ80_003521 [Entomortierella chlamydospora]
MSKNPFDYPEIRSRLALFVSLESALSCIRVSKGFSQDFAYPIWHTINFGTQKTLVQKDSTILKKYGHHIRVVKGIETQAHLDLLLDLEVSQLLGLELKTTMDPFFQASCYDLVRQNQTTLTNFKIQNKNNEYTSVKFIFLDSLTSPQSSRLTTFTIRWLTLTRDSLTSILRYCPALDSIDLWGTTLTPSRKFDDYQHAGLTTLQIKVTEAIKTGSLPLIAHFPNLKKWRIGDSATPSAFPSQVVKDSISKWCPHLKTLETNFTPSLLLNHLILDVFSGLTGLMFDYREISSNIILALLRTPSNWVHLSTYTDLIGSYDHHKEDGVAEVKDHFQSSSWMLQSVVRSCPKLETFRFPNHEMDMDEIELSPWACTNLSDLRVRIKGLDTRDKIERTLARWRNRKLQESLDTATEDPESIDWEGTSIEARAVRHLLQFDKLETVWLGTGIWEV